MKMDGMIDFLHGLGLSGLRYFWIPMTTWTVLVIVLLAFLRSWRSAHSLVHYAGRVALLFALPAGLIIAPWIDFPILSGWTVDTVPEIAASSPISSAESPTITGEATPPAFPLEHVFTTFGILILLAGAVSLSALLYTYRDFLLLKRLIGQHARHSVPRQVREVVEAQARLHGIKRPIRIVITAAQTPPMTFGWRKPVLLIPDSVLDDPAALLMTVNHELVHISRHDDLFRKIEIVLGIVFKINPAVGHLCRSITYYREVSCDAAVLAHSDVSSRVYAALLYRFATLDRPVLSPLIGMVNSQPELTKRIKAMKHAHHTAGNYLSPGRTALIFSTLLLAAVTLIVACTDAIGPQADNQAKDEEIFVVVEKMPELIGGMTSLQNRIQYPEVAKKAGIQGKVVVELIVDKQGRVKDEKVVRGIGGGCDEEALRAVRLARFEPGMQRGKPVEVKLAVPILFKLGEDPAFEGIEVQENMIKVEGIRHLSSQTPTRFIPNPKAGTITNRSVVSLASTAVPTST